MANDAYYLSGKIDHRQTGEVIGVEEFDDLVSRCHGLYLHDCAVAEIAERQLRVGGD